MNYELMTTQNAPVKCGQRRTGRRRCPSAADQYGENAVYFKHIAVMPDVHLGKGSTIGQRDPRDERALFRRRWYVDIGCGMNALRTSLTAADLPENLAELRNAARGRCASRAYHRTRASRCGRMGKPPANVDEKWAQLEAGYQWLTQNIRAF